MNRKKEILAAVIMAAALCSGVLLRASADFPLIQSELIYAAPEKVTIPDPVNPADTVKRFYLLFDRGMYEQAWKISMEPDWAGKRKTRYQDDLKAGSDSFTGWTEKETFIKRCVDDIGPGGIYLSLSHVRVKSHRSEISELPYREFREISGIKKVYKVTATGDFLASCAVYRWKKDLYVLETDSGFKVLLEGTKSSRELFHMNWLNFSNKKLIRELRSQ